jgi:hypothetical protein
MSEPPNKKRRQAISVETKLKFLRAYDQRGTGTIRDVAKGLNIPSSTLATIVSHREAIEEQAQSGCSLKRKTSRRPKFEDLEEFLLEFFNECRQNNIPVSGPVLLHKAEEIALKLGIDADFKASKGWLDKFKKRHNIGSVKICGEENAVDTSVVNDWHVNYKDILSKYEPDNTYNLDELGLFYNALPESTLDYMGDKCHGGKKSKLRVTVALCVNKTGTDKLKPVFIGKSANPRCLKNVNKTQLPVVYEYNRKAWMNQTIFTMIMTRLQRKAACQNRKFLIILDNATCHKLDYNALNFTNLEIIFLPPNSTSKSQPLDKGIIQNVKVFYRRKLVQYYLRSIGELYKLQ